jgi:hypothetical protein
MAPNVPPRQHCYGTDSELLCAGVLIIQIVQGGVELLNLSSMHTRPYHII